MLLHEKLKEFNIILASASPRRRELLKETGIDYRLATKFECDECYPATLPTVEVAPYLATLKSHAYPFDLAFNDILITADTTVVLEGEVLGKPTSTEEAKQMIARLAGKEHFVVTGVTLRSKERERTFASSSRVRFASLTAEEIEYYVERYNPMDKAGAYGIQEWIGYVAIEGINGSFFNVMGLPVQRLYVELGRLIDTL